MAATPGLRAPVTPGDLGQFHDMGAVGLSADGTLVVAVVSTPDIDANRYRRVVVTGPADGSAALRGLPSATAVAEMLPAWAPAGHALATVRQDEKGWSIWLHSLDDAAAEPLVADWPDPIGELSWSPTGGRLLFVAREPTDRGWWALPEDRRPPLRITTLRYRESRCLEGGPSHPPRTWSGARLAGRRHPVAPLIPGCPRVTQAIPGRLTIRHERRSSGIT